MIFSITYNDQPPVAVLLVVLLVVLQGARERVPSLAQRETQGLLRVALVVAELVASLAAARYWST